MDRLIYLDNAATTPVKKVVLEEMLPYFGEAYANPSALYRFAGEATDAVDKARDQAAALIGAKPEEIYFTGGGSESDNWAIKAAAQAYASKGKHIITSRVEHHAVLHTCEYLQKQGFEVTYLGVDEDGRVSLEELKAPYSITFFIYSWYHSRFYVFHIKLECIWYIVFYCFYS